MVWNANAEVQNTVQGYNGDLGLFLRVSHDAGKTWGDCVVLSDETVKANQYEPGIAIAPNGTVHVAWYDFKHSPTNMLVTTGHSGDTGISDVYYTSSADHGATWAPPIRVNDRGIDRSKGVWSNNIDSKFNVGVAATNENVFFALQDTRNALGGTGSEDIYISSVPLTPVTLGESDGGTPGWTLLLTRVFSSGWASSWPGASCAGGRRRPPLFREALPPGPEALGCYCG